MAKVTHVDGEAARRNRSQQHSREPARQVDRLNKEIDGTVNGGAMSIVPRNTNGRLSCRYLKLHVCSMCCGLVADPSLLPSM